MAGDWIKMRVDLADDPAVIGIAAETGLDEFAVIGRLHKLWSWADQQLRNGDAPVTQMFVDRAVSFDGFAEAMAKVGWLKILPTGIALPNFDRHNGKGAKNRALTRDRMKRHRDAGVVTPPSPEKRREVPNNHPTVTTSTVRPQRPAENPVRTSSSTPRAAAHSTTKTERQLAEQAKAEAAKSAPPGGSVAAFVKAATGGESLKPPDHFEIPRSETGDVPWWHSPAGIQSQAVECGVHVIPEEPFDEFVARVCAAKGPGPWIDEQPPALRDRIEAYRTGEANP